MALVSINLSQLVFRGSEFLRQCMTATDMQMSYYDCCVMLGAPLFMAIYDNIVHWGVRPIVVYASTVD